MPCDVLLLVTWQTATAVHRLFHPGENAVTPALVQLLSPDYSAFSKGTKGAARPLVLDVHTAQTSFCKQF